MSKSTVDFDLLLSTIVAFAEAYHAAHSIIPDALSFSLLFPFFALLVWQASGTITMAPNSSVCPSLLS